VIKILHNLALFRVKTAITPPPKCFDENIFNNHNICHWKWGDFDRAYEDNYNEQNASKLQ
jgi:hypothetical protein